MSIPTNEWSASPEEWNELHLICHHNKLLGNHQKAQLYWFDLWELPLSKYTTSLALVIDTKDSAKNKLTELQSKNKQI